MHIPDGYLNLPTCATTYCVMAPIWAFAAKKLKDSFEAKKVPLVALGAAFSFVLMMFNFPVPGGSSGHAVGGGLLAILLGPWLAVSVLSVVLAIQAFLFHDGGLTTFAANAFNMAFVLPISSYMVYRAFANPESRLFRKALAGALAGYIGLTLSAFTTAVMLGIQPHGVSGYAPYPLRITIPVMVGSHLLAFSWVEGFVTAFVLIWMTKNFSEGINKIQSSTQSVRKGWIVVFVLIFLSPLGFLSQGTAFGEWNKQELRKLFGYVPMGLANLSKIWEAPFAGYRITGHSLLVGYFVSAAIGTFAAALFALALGKIFSKGSQVPSPKEARDEVKLKTSLLPDWMLKREELAPPAKKNRTDRGQKAFSQIKHFFSHTLRAEELQGAPGFLQKRDPRAKVIILFLLILATAWIKSVLLLFVLLGVASMLCVVSRIPIFWFARYVLLTMAVFSLLVALPAAFAWVTPGKPLLTLVAPYLVITREGALGVGLFMLRSTTAIAFSSLLSLTTSWTKLLGALQVLRVPHVFLFMVEMAYRYIFLFVRLVEQMNYARNARMIGPFSTEGEQRWTGGRIAFLLHRSMDLAENVHLAMQARGYDGKLDNRAFTFGAYHQ